MLFQFTPTRLADGLELESAPESSWIPKPLVTSVFTPTTFIGFPASRHLKTGISALEYIY
jgi:hypothetical protein